MLQIFLNLWLIPDFPTGADSKLPSSFKDACGYSNLNKAVSSRFSGSLWSPTVQHDGLAHRGGEQDQDDAAQSKALIAQPVDVLG